jgi:hypothetical protein
MEGGDPLVTDRMIHGGWMAVPIVGRLHDDGTYEEVQVQPAKFTAAQWQAFKAGGDEQALEQVRQQIEQPAPGETGEPT